MAVTERCATPAGPRPPSTPIFRHSRGGEGSLDETGRRELPAHPGGATLGAASAARPGLPPEEIRALFGACEADDSSIGYAMRNAGRHSRLRPAPVRGGRAGFA
jgi:hypothetical protein